MSKVVLAQSDAARRVPQSGLLLWHYWSTIVPSSRFQPVPGSILGSGCSDAYSHTEPSVQVHFFPKKINGARKVGWGHVSQLVGAYQTRRLWREGGRLEIEAQNPP
eukprot:2249375-Rhodomonas_salina.4